MPYCQSCTKLVGLEMQDPEMEDAELSGNEVRTSCRLVRCCVDCGDEMKEATLEFTTEFDPEILKAHDGEDHALSVELDDPSWSEEMRNRKGKVVKRGTTYFTVHVTGTVNCSCTKEPLCDVEMTDEITASGMDDV